MADRKISELPLLNQGDLLGATDYLPIVDPSEPVATNRTKRVIVNSLVRGAQVIQSGTGAVARTVESRLRDTLSVLDFGAVGDGVTNDSAAFQAFVNACAAQQRGGLVPVPLNLANTEITVPSNTDIEFVGAGKLINGEVTMTGSLGSEIGLTADSVKGSSTVSVPTTGLAVGDVLLIRSCINCLSADAGDDRLGAIAGEKNFFGEFITIRTIGTGTITLENPLIFPYTITPGPSSGTRTNSTVQKVTFVQNIRLRNIVMEGRRTVSNQSILCTLGRDVDISGEFSDTGATGYFVRFHRSYQCKVSQAVTRRPAYSLLPVSSTYNHFLTTGSQQCGFENLTCTGGYQCVDFTFLTTPAESVANPSIACFVRNAQFTQCLDGATSHAGNWASIFENVHTLNTVRGFRLRSRNDLLVNFSCINTAPSNGGSGVFVEEGYHSGTVIGNGTMRGFLNGIEIDAFNVDGEPTVRGGVTISNVTMSDCSFAVIIDTQPAKADYTPILLDSITAIRCTNGIRVNPYNNGITIRNFTALGPFLAGGRAGIEWNLNVVGLTIDGARFINLAGIFGLRGPSGTSFITDTTTFPTGNAAANLVIRNVSFDGQTAGTETASIIRDPTAFSSNLNGFEQSYTIGAHKVRLNTAQTTDLQEWQGSTGTKLLGVSDTGQLTGSVATTAKAAIAAAADLAALKTALAGLFD